MKTKQGGEKLNIYIGNISWDTTDSGLKAAFEAFGQVESATIIKDRATGRSKGFAFVEMPNDEEAKAAITGMTGKELDGRELRVNEAKPRDDAPARSSSTASSEDEEPVYENTPEDDSA
ncbi:MAG: RNA-binding protein [archaeon]